MNRRDFLATSTALAATAGWQASPPNATQATTVLFQGDSITDSGRDRNSKDANAGGALGSGYPLLVTASALAAHPDRGLKFYNRGVSGNTVPDLEARWRTDTLDLQPDVLSILIGVNDIWHKLNGNYAGTVQDYEQQYTALLDETRRALPKTQIIVLEPFVLRCGAVTARWFPEFDERRAAAARVAKQARASFVALQAVFDQKTKSSRPEYWAADGVHPTPAGHAAIAEQWRRAAHL